MSEIRIDSAKVLRIVAQILRDDHKFLPAVANIAALRVTERLIASMGTPAHQRLGTAGYRLLKPHPPHDDDFAQVVSARMSERSSDIDDATARALWDLVYARAEDLPPGVAETMK